MQYREFKHDTNKEDLQGVADISVVKEFDLHRRVRPSRELLDALTNTQHVDFLRLCLRRANPNWVRAFDRRRAQKE